LLGQTLLLPEAHLPLLQRSSSVHGLLSSHFSFSPDGDEVQTPSSWSQLSVVQAFPSLHTFASPGEHKPFWHASLVVHGLPSSHELPCELA
jgi:hypothetical protein